MRKLRLLLLLLLPSLLWAGTVTVKKAEKIQQPAGTIDRVSKRTANGKVFEFDHIGSGRFVSIISAEPIHYLDSTGVYRDYNFDSEPDTVAGFTVVRTGKFDVAYDSTGRIRYQKKDALLTLSPAFNRANVDIDFYIHRNGLKANYILKNSSAPNVLKWLVTANDTVEDAGGGKGKGNLKKASKVMGQIAEFTAIDAMGKVLPLTATYKKDSLIVTIDVVGAVHPVRVDPSIVDTIKINTSSYGMDQRNKATWLGNRDTINALPLYSDSTIFEIGRINAYNQRTALTFDPVVAVSVIDSVRYYQYHTQGHPDTGTKIVYSLVMGTFKGAPGDSWYNDFYGWAASGAYTPTYWSADSIVIPYEATAWYSLKFSTQGCDSVKAVLNRGDSLRVMALTRMDISGNAAYSADSITSYIGLSLATNPIYIKIYYGVNPPGVTTVSDTAKAAAVLYATIDSVGSANATARGFKIWKSGGTAAADTITLTKSGSFAAGAFRDTTRALYPDTMYLYKGFATNTGGTGYGAIDSFTATLTGSTIMFDGRAIGGIH